MDEHLHHDLIDDIRRYSTEVTGVIDTEKCLVRKAGMFYIVDLHIEVDGSLSVFDGHEIAHRLKDHLMKKLPGIADVHIHVEPVRTIV
jgi:divalent metal cation (Fe/Co/Zn/Cd) transporter